jgi:hypothetical protein
MAMAAPQIGAAPGDHGMTTYWEYDNSLASPKYIHGFLSHFPHPEMGAVWWNETLIAKRLCNREFPLRISHLIVDVKELTVNKQLKGRPRGRPFKPGESGNRAGRPQGSLNKTTLAVLAGIREAEAELAKPLLLDKSRPFECWSDRFVQDGRDFHKFTLELLNKDAPAPIQPEMLDIREARQDCLWKGRLCHIQHGWLFDRRTQRAVKV